MCDRCKFDVDAETYHYEYAWVVCSNAACVEAGEMQKPRRIYRDTRTRLPTHALCGTQVRKTANPRHVRGAGAYTQTNQQAGVVYKQFVRGEDGKLTGEYRYSIPMRPDAPPPPNSERIEHRSIADMEQFYRETGKRNELLDFSNPDAHLEDMYKDSYVEDPWEDLGEGGAIGSDLSALKDLSPD